jgi:hypothetical protein
MSRLDEYRSKIMEQIKERTRDKKSWNIVKAIYEMFNMGYYQNPEGNPEHEKAIVKILENNGFLKLESVFMIKPRGKAKSFPNTGKKQGQSTRGLAARGDDSQLKKSFIEGQDFPCGTFIDQPWGSKGWPDFIIKVHPKFILFLEAKSSQGTNPKYNSGGLHLGVVYIFSSRAGYKISSLIEAQKLQPTLLAGGESTTGKAFGKTLTELKWVPPPAYPVPNGITRTALLAKYNVDFKKWCQNGGPALAGYNDTNISDRESHAGVKMSGKIVVHSHDNTPVRGATTIYMGNHIITEDVERMMRAYREALKGVGDDIMKQGKLMGKDGQLIKGDINAYNFNFKNPRPVFEADGNYFAPYPLELGKKAITITSKEYEESIIRRKKAETETLWFIRERGLNSVRDRGRRVDLNEVHEMGFMVREFRWSDEDCNMDEDKFNTAYHSQMQMWRENKSGDVPFISTKYRMLDGFNKENATSYLTDIAAEEAKNDDEDEEEEYDDEDEEESNVGEQKVADVDDLQELARKFAEEKAVAAKSSFLNLASKETQPNIYQLQVQYDDAEDGQPLLRRKIIKNLKDFGVEYAKLKGGGYRKRKKRTRRKRKRKKKGKKTKRRR